MYFESLWNEFSRIPEVEAIALGGSRAGMNYDEKSDYDMYVYCNRIPEETVGKQSWRNTASIWRLEILFGSLRMTVR